MKSRIILALAIGIAAGWNACAQGTVDDYVRAYRLADKFNQSKVLFSGVRAQWLPDSHSFWYVRNEADGVKRHILVDADKRSSRALFNATDLAKRLSAATSSEVDPLRLLPGRLEVNRTADTLRFEYNGHRWLYLPKRNRLDDCGTIMPPAPEPHWMVVDDEKTNGPVTSPDGRLTAYIKNDNIYVKNNADGKERQLSFDGTPGNYYSSYIAWSPDSRKVAATRIRPAEKRFVHYVESSPADQLQPRLHTQEYAKPGDELQFRVPCVYNAETGEASIPATDLFASQYYVTAPVWDADSRAVTFEFNERGHKTYRVLELAAEGGKIRPLIEETSDTYVNYPFVRRYDLEDGRHIIWASQRDNWNHLYLYDRENPDAPQQITRGDFFVREVQHIDEKNRRIYFSANGAVPGEDPYYIRYYSINFDGTGLTELTPQEGMHSATYSSDHTLLVDVWSTVDMPEEAVVRSASDGSMVMGIEKADISALVAEGWKAPEVFTAPGRDGTTPMWGLIYRPTDFDPSKKYPVVEYIYQGPGSAYVPKTFHAFNYAMSPLAELGFVVVMVDGMGTSYRSRSFENMCYKNLSDAGLPDHMAWLKAAGEKYPYLDLDRVGIFGASAGGQESTTAVLLHPEFYKAAYSACGCHDNRMDKIWWNELWMGYPVGEHYAACSNVVNAHLLSRPLMLVVGELDDNVDPASTMQVADALIKANKDFELVVLPGVHHTLGEKYGEHKRFDFFTRHLLGVTPPSWPDIEAALAK